jgi:hypothetical protein
VQQEHPSHLSSGQVPSAVFEQGQGHPGRQNYLHAVHLLLSHSLEFVLSEKESGQVLRKYEAPRGIVWVGYELWWMEGNWIWSASLLA